MVAVWGLTRQQMPLPICEEHHLARRAKTFFSFILIKVAGGPNKGACTVTVAGRTLH